MSDWDQFKRKDGAVNPWDQFAAKAPKADVIAIDFNRPVSEVRADIAKLSGPDREKALRAWADAFVAGEQARGDIGPVSDGARALARGTFLGPWLDEITAGTQAGLHAITGGNAGSPYDEAVAYQRARDRAFDESNPIGSPVLQLTGGLTGGIGAARTALKSGPGAINVAVGGPLAAVQPAATLPRQMAQGAGIGAAYAGAAGAGAAEGDIADRAVGAINAAPVGAIAGAVLPPVAAGIGKAATMASDAISPQVARLQGATNDFLARYKLPSFSIEAFKPLPSGVDNASDQIIANQLSRAGVSAGDLRNRLSQAAEGRQFYSGSFADDVVAPVDLDPSLQRLAGSVVRQQPEAGNVASAFIKGRQTGITPDGPLPTRSNVPTRNQFATPGKDDRPAGQFERVRDALKRAFTISDTDFHGHAKNAYATENAIIEAAKREADELYGEMRKAAQNLNIAPQIDPVLAKWTALADEQTAPVARALKRAVSYFKTQNGETQTNAARFDVAKRYLDDVIDKMYRGGDRYLGGQLTAFKNELLDTLDNVSVNGFGEKYKAARNAYSSRMESRDALNLGRQMFKEDADVAVDQYRALATDGERKLFRLGMLHSFEQRAGRKGRQMDITRLFDDPRIQEILTEVIPASKKGVFANRPERFGTYLDTERGMIETRNAVVGNSMTARNIQDDAALSGMQTVSGAIEQLRQTPSITGIGIRVVERILDSLFGFRADTAAAIAQKLFTANPQDRAVLIARLETLMGQDRAGQFARLISEYSRVATQAGAISAGNAQGAQ